MHDTKDTPTIDGLWNEITKHDPEYSNIASLLDDINVTDLVKSFIDQQTQEADQEKYPLEKAPTLLELTIDCIAAQLDSGDQASIDEQIGIIVGNLDPPFLSRILLSGRLPFHILLKLFDCSYKRGHKHIDIDLAILRHSEYFYNIRYDEAKARKFLYKLNEVEEILKDRGVEGCSPLVIERKLAPDGGFELFDRYRAQKIWLNLNMDEIKPSFWSPVCPILNILDDIDWTNAALVGCSLSQAVTCVTAIDGSWPVEGIGKAPAVICIYGTSNWAEASAKIWHINDVLTRINDSSNSYEITFIKDLHQTSFYVNHHLVIEVIHFNFASITDILARFPVDSGALIFDGNDIFFTARCIRAFETGYSILMPDSLHKFQPNLPQIALAQITHMADQGFGVRVLPDYVTTLAPSVSAGHRQRSERLQSLKHLAKHTWPSEYFHLWRYWENADLDNIRIEDKAHGGPTVFSREGKGVEQQRSIITAGAYSLKTLIWYEKMWADGQLLDSSCFSIFPFNSSFLFDNFMHPAVEARLGRQVDRSEFVNYLSRRIRHVVVGDFDDYKAKKNVFPMILPKSLEDYIMQTWEMSKTYSSNTTRPIIIDVYNDRYSVDSSRPLPVLPNNDTEEGNLRYWTVGRQYLWRGYNKTQDLVFSVLWSLAKYAVVLAHGSPTYDDLDGSQYFATFLGLKYHLLMQFREISIVHKALTRSALARDDTDVDSSRVSSCGMTTKEVQRFRLWASIDSPVGELETYLDSPSGNHFGTRPKLEEDEHKSVIDEDPYTWTHWEDVSERSSELGSSSGT